MSVSDGFHHPVFSFEFCAESQRDADRIVLELMESQKGNGYFYRGKRFDIPCLQFVEPPELMETSDWWVGSGSYTREKQYRAFFVVDIPTDNYWEERELRRICERVVRTTIGVDGTFLLLEDTLFDDEFDEGLL